MHAAGGFMEDIPIPVVLGHIHEQRLVVYRCCEGTYRHCKPPSSKHLKSFIYHFHPPFSIYKMQS
jgi:hypothetical protein